MKRLFFLLSLFVFLLSFPLFSVIAESELDMYLNDFYQKQEKASQLLKEIETDLKKGTRDRVCARQREAASYGIEATESLIKALKSKGSQIDIENFEEGLDKWRDLREKC